MTDNLFSKDFWKAALARALHTMAQTALGVIGATAFIEKVNWVAVASAAALAAIVSIIKSVAIGVPETETKIEYRYLDENGVPVDGNFMTVLNNEEQDNDAD